MKWLKKLTLIKLAISMLSLIILFIAGIYITSFLLGPPQINIDQNTTLYSVDGNILGMEHGQQKRQWVHLDDIAPILVEATLASEDQHFYNHHGFDIPRIIHALWTDLRSLSLKEGASTLTQQYARNLYLSPAKTWTRKIKEAFNTIRLEMFYTKDDILEGYLNTIYYGHGAYGIDGASHYYFNKSASELDTAEAAMLAGIPKGPSYYSPIPHLKRAKKRQRVILGLLHTNGKINDQTYKKAMNEKLTFHKADKTKKKLAPYFQDAVVKEAAKLLGITRDDVRSGGYQIETTLNINQQRKLQATVQDVFHHQGEMQVGVIAMDPKTGGIRAMIGGRHHNKSVYNRAMQAKRMPGSSFKPFLYYAALTHGYTPTTMLMSEPTTFKLDDGTTYQPGNFDGYYANKPITLAQALALSDNIYAVKTAIAIGSDTVVDTARKFGITSPMPHVPSIALGTASISVEEMVTGYGMIANGGHKINGHTINKIKDRTGKVIYQRQKSVGKQVLDKKKAYILTQLMTGMFDPALNGYMAVTGSTIKDELTHTYAGKSGTTSADSWMIGFSPDLVTGVWTGYDDNRDIEKVAERTYAKEIWAQFMEKAQKDLPDDTTFTKPKGIIKVDIDPYSGDMATPYCPTKRAMYFEKGNKPKNFCKVHLPDTKSESEKPTKKQESKKGIIQRLLDRLFHFGD